MSAETPNSAAGSLWSSQRPFGLLRDWLMVAWVLWWSWAYAQSALGHRFPQLLAWLQWNG
jgi:hypothetical protein